MPHFPEASVKLKNHRIEGIPYLAARQIGGTITPDIVVLHDTAGSLNPGSSRDFLATSAAVSVHFVIERDGAITQLVPTNRRAAHAGQSSFHGRADCNGFSIGIEIVNPGRLTRVAGGGAVSWFGQDYGYGEFKLADLTTPQHGAGTWMAYTQEQIEAVIALLEALFAGIKTLKDITTHWYISPGRKVDTNPLFPVNSVRARILGRDDPALQEADAASAAADEEGFVQVDTAGDTLNLRRWPSFNPNILAAIPDGAIVPVIRRGSFGGRGWLKVIYAGLEGWIVETYAAPIRHAVPPDTIGF